MNKLRIIYMIRRGAMNIPSTNWEINYSKIKIVSLKLGEFMSFAMNKSKFKSGGPVSKDSPYLTDI